MKGTHFVAMQLLFSQEGKEGYFASVARWKNLRRGCDVFFYGPVNKDTASRQLTSHRHPKTANHSHEQRVGQVKIVKLIDEAIRTTGGGNSVARKKELKLENKRKGDCRR